ncbi:hypothetical protein [Deinococcus radiophilus]|uniref:Uncharacterized protein n=1 Tax=Deinococcus radiophilus TaxID=32062 RepID=A0A3S0RID8_9DEIO|nr:hypothetical protein [Deinococcus radiophilus]RTR29075.1 hypothetical protein EJ104_04315 [Deinococcus radiophilus]UFA49661.1 hypothetical protein LMT64_07075 [Deinococcus radiophilus]
MAALLLAASLWAALWLIRDIPAQVERGQNVQSVQPSNTPEQCGIWSALPESRNPPVEVQPGVWRLIRTSGIQFMACDPGTLSLVASPDPEQAQDGASLLSIWQDTELLQTVEVGQEPRQVSLEIERGPIYLTLDNGSAFKVTSARRVWLSNFTLN